MKVLIFNLSLFIVFAVVFGRPSDKYTTKYDNIDLDEILSNERLLKNYFDCIMDRGKCTPDGQELRSVLVDALETDCSKCSDTQNKGAHKVAKYLYENKMNMFEELKGKYDPEEKYINKYREEAKKEGIDI